MGTFVGSLWALGWKNRPSSWMLVPIASKGSLWDPKKLHFAIHCGVNLEAILARDCVMLRMCVAGQCQADFVSLCGVVHICIKLKRASRSFAKTGFQSGFLGGPKVVPKKVPKKSPQMDPKWSTKRIPESPKRRLKVGSRKGSQNGCHFEGWTSEILMVYTTNSQYQAFLKTMTFGIHFGYHFGAKVYQKRG